MSADTATRPTDPGSTRDPSGPTGVFTMVTKRDLIVSIVGLLVGGAGLGVGNAVGGSSYVTKSGLIERFAHHYQVDALERQKLEMSIDNVVERLDSIEDKLDDALKE